LVSPAIHLPLSRWKVPIGDVATMADRFDDQPISISIPP